MADDVPRFDDIPSFDDLPDAASTSQPQRSSAPPQFDDIPDFDALPDQGNGQSSEARNSGPAPEGPFMSGVREAAHAVIPAVAGTIAGGAGAVLGTAALPGPGTIAGGAAGFIGGSMATDYVQEKALNALGFDDSDQRAANAAANPKASFIGGLAPAVATMNPVAAGEKLSQRALQRGIGGGVMAGFEAGQEAVNNGEVDPTRVAIAAATGAVFPSVNRVGEKLMGAGARLVPGRPNRTSNPAADQAHADVDDISTEQVVGDSSLAQPPPGPDGVTTGNPQSAPERSERQYGKAKPVAETEGDALTQGQIAPDTAAALAEANPAADAAAVPPAPPQQGAAPPVQQAAQVNAGKPRLGLKRPAPEPQVETGIPQAGEPVAVGENEATPMPANMPAKAAAAIKKSKGKMAPTAPEAEPAPPPITGETPINDSITEGQKAAGNYPKARSNDFGKPIAIETHAGDTRRGSSPTGEAWENVSPYEYGYFNKTKGPDGDHIDFARPKDGSPELGDKHFIIDQKDAATGKYDEPKVFTYYKDEAAARDAFAKGFSDGKGPDRLQSITEVSRPDLVKFLAKHTTKPPAGPYGETPAKAAPAKATPKVVTEAVKLARSQGNEQVAAAIEASGNAVEAAKYLNAKTNKTGKSDITSARIRPKPPEVPGAPGITARSKADAARKGAALEQMKKAVADNPPAHGDMRARLEKMVKDAGISTKTYKPAVKPPEFLLLRKAEEMLKRKTWKREHVAEFEANEKLARSENPDDHQLLRGGNRIEADIGRSRRSGEAAIADAENKQARFDIPHEEAEAMVEPTPVRTKADLKELPRRTATAADMKGINTEQISRDVLTAADKRKAEAAALSGKKAPAANVPAEEKPASAVRKIKIDDAEKERILASMTAATKKAAARDPKLDATGPTEGAAPKKGIVDLVDRFANDERGSVDIDKIKADIKKAMKPDEASSYIARDAKEPSADYTRSLSEDLHRISQEDKSHRVGLIQASEKLPKEMTDKVLEKMYLAHEAGKLNILTPEERALYDTHLKPVFDENEQFVKNIRAIDPDRMGADVLNHISRVTKGDTSAYNMLKDKDDPTGPGVHGLAVNSNFAKNRKFVAMERADGKRIVVSPTDNGYTIWDKYKRIGVRDPSFDFEAGKAHSVNLKNKTLGLDGQYTMKDALTPEIEANAKFENNRPARYYKNAGLSAYMANAQLGSMARHLVELERIKQTPEFSQMSTRNAATAHDRGWQESKLPNMKGIFMDDQLRYVFDDFAKPGFDTPDALRNLNQAITKTIFWNPVPHIANVATHWVVGRGWDWITPYGARSLAVDGTKAIVSVIKQDKLQQDLRNAGAGTVSGGVVTRKFIEKIAKNVHEDIERNPSKWGPIADTLGVPLSKLGSAIYDGSSKIMWAANDMFLTQRILENERKGMPRSQAIIQAERDIPNYRVPTTIMGSGKWARMASQAMQDPALTSFGRYHYAVFNSYANIVKSAVGKKASFGERLDAVGKMMAMGVLAYGVYPLIDKMARMASGNEEATENRRGPVSIPHHIGRALQGKEDLPSAGRSTMTIPPFWATMLEAYSNKDFRGKQIFEPGDVRSAAGGNLKAAGRVGVQGAEHTARGLFSPYSTFANADKKGVNAAGAVRDQLLDIKNPSAKAVKYERMVPIKTDRDARTRFKQSGSGPLEGLYDKMLGYR